MSADARRFDPLTGRPLPAQFDPYTGMPLIGEPAVVDGVPAGTTLSSPGKRLAATLLDSVLCVVSLFVGWLVWSLIVMEDGKTPANS